MVILTKMKMRPYVRTEKGFLRFNTSMRSPRLRPTALWIEQGYSLAQALSHGKREKI